MADTLVLTCNVADYDATTQTCSAPFYAAPEGFLPTLAIADAQSIGFAVALLWACAWVFRPIKRAMNIG